MLLRFEASNHRSIFEPVEMSMFAVDNDRPEARKVEGADGHVVTVAGIYGPNASGKSNVLDALMWLSDAVANSFRIWEEKIPREPFLFKSGYSKPSNFNIDIVEKERSYSYEIEVNEDEILFESCHADIYGDSVRLFLREGDKFELNQPSDYGVDIKGLLTPTTLLLSIVRRLSTMSNLGESDINCVADSLSKFSFRFSGISRNRFGRLYPGSSLQALVDDAHPLNRRKIESSEIDRKNFYLQRERAVRLLQLADLGINDVQIRETFDDSRERVVKQMHFVHVGKEEEMPFERSDESSGTLTWTQLIPIVLAALEAGEVLVIDELDANIHPRLSSALIQMFQDPTDNPHNAQLIFSAHDVSLLGVLNRDEIWLTSKSEDGSTELAAIAEFQGKDVAESRNLETSYLIGRFGAVPNIDRFIMRASP